MLFKEVYTDKNNNFKLLEIWEEDCVLHMLEHANGCRLARTPLREATALKRAKKNLVDILDGKPVSFKLGDGYSTFSTATEADIKAYEKQEKEFEEDYRKALIEYYEQQSEVMFSDLKKAFL